LIWLGGTTDIGRPQLHDAMTLVGLVFENHIYSRAGPNSLICSICAFRSVLNQK